MKIAPEDEFNKKLEKKLLDKGIDSKFFVKIMRNVENIETFERDEPGHNTILGLW